MPRATEPAEGHNTGDTLSCDGGRWLHGEGFCGSMAGGHLGVWAPAKLQLGGSRMSLRCRGSGHGEG